MTSSILTKKFLSNRLNILLNIIENNFSENSENNFNNSEFISSSKKLFLIGKIFPTNLHTNNNINERIKKNKFLVKNEEENFSNNTTANSNFLKKKRFITFDTNILKEKNQKFIFFENKYKIFANKFTKKFLEENLIKLDAMNNNNSNNNNNENNNDKNQNNENNNDEDYENNFNIFTNIPDENNKNLYNKKNIIFKNTFFNNININKFNNDIENKEIITKINISKPNNIKNNNILNKNNFIERIKNLKSTIEIKLNKNEKFIDPIIFKTQRKNNSILRSIYFQENSDYQINYNYLLNNFSDINESLIIKNSKNNENKENKENNENNENDENNNLFFSSFQIIENYKNFKNINFENNNNNQNTNNNNNLNFGENPLNSFIDWLKWLNTEYDKDQNSQIKLLIEDFVKTLNNISKSISSFPIFTGIPTNDSNKQYLKKYTNNKNNKYNSKKNILYKTNSNISNNNKNNINNNNKKFICEFCNEIFFSGQGLGGHMSRKHKDQSIKFKHKKEVRNKREPLRKILFLSKNEICKNHNINFEENIKNKEGKLIIKKLIKDNLEEYKNLKNYFKKIITNQEKN